MKKIPGIILMLVFHITLAAQTMSETDIMNQYSIALSCMTKGNRQYAEARAIFEKILPYADEKMRHRILSRIPMSWYFESMVSQIGQDYVHALECAENAQKGFHDIGDTKNEIDALMHIGAIKNQIYDLSGALNMYVQAAQLATLLHYDVKQMLALKELYKINELLGDDEGKILVRTKMDSLVSRIDDNSIKFEYYNLLGDECKNQGRYVLSERWYRKNDDYVNKLDETYTGSDRYIHHSNIRNLYIKTENWREALKYAFMCRDEFQMRYGENDKDYYMPYMGIADIYRLMGDSVRCFHSLDTLFFSIERYNEPREKQYLYVTRGRCYSAFGNYEKALADYKTADDLLVKKYGTSDADRLRLLPLMGGMEHKLKRYEDAERLYRKYYESIKHLYGEEHIKCIEGLIYLANAEAFTEHIDVACADYAKAVEALRRLLQMRLPYMTSEERESYWMSVSQLMQRMTPFALKAGKCSDEFTKACYDALILSKTFLLTSECSTYSLIKNKGTEEDLHDYIAIASIQSKVKELERHGEEYADSIFELVSKQKILETKLARHCRRYGDITSFMNIGYNDVRKELGIGDILIDFTDFDTETNGRVYAAYVVDSQQSNPVLIRLFEESVIDSMKVQKPDMYYSGTFAEKMCDLVWKPFRDKVTEGTKIYYVPSRLMYQIALESLPMEDGMLLGDHYQFIRLSSAREIISEQPQLKFDVNCSCKNAILYGGLKYDLTAREMKEEAVKYDVSSLFATRGNALRGDSIYEELPETKKEIERVSAILKKHDLDVEMYSDGRGTEESFISMSGSAPQLLHVATHGFYYTPEKAEAVDYLRGYTDAMLLSGIVMSGGNAAWTGKELPKGVLGGILTADDISRLDLSDVQMAVLSACQTGQGKATPEGLYGLQRAFKKAGVRTLVMSLWNVSDVVTKEFMVRFYENLANYNWNKRKAFFDARSYIRKKYADPYYWAGFVMLD